MAEISTEFDAMLLFWLIKNVSVTFFYPFDGNDAGIRICITGILQIIRSYTYLHLVFYSVFDVIVTVLDRHLHVEQHKNPYYLCFVASFLTDHGGVVSRATVEKELKNISTIWISRERREVLDSLALVLCSHFGKPVKTSFLIRYLIDNFADKAVAELVSQHQPRRDK